MFANLTRNSGHVTDSGKKQMILLKRRLMNMRMFLVILLRSSTNVLFII